MEHRKIVDHIYREYTLQQQAQKCNSSILKRAVDIFFSITFLVILSPFLLIAALLIKMTSEGPVFFLQKRVGLHNSRFTFIKFRSMRAGTDDNAHRIYTEALITGLKSHIAYNAKDVKVYKMLDDTRMTPLGKIIRKLSIDEIPQFVNVLKGDMSIVGPRPPIPYELEHYNKRAKKRLLVRPGITGLWQVSGRSTTTFERMIALDLCYIMHWSIWQDIMIMLRTFKAIFETSKAG